MRLNLTNIFSLIDQKPLEQYILLATYFVWLLKPFKESFGFFFTKDFSQIHAICWCHLSHVSCHMLHVRCQILDVTRHMSPVANAIVICWPPCLFTRLESLAWSQQGFWQSILCRKHSYEAFVVMGELIWGFGALLAQRKGKMETS